MVDRRGGRRERDELGRRSGLRAQGGGTRPTGFDKNTPPFSPFLIFLFQAA